jgi:polyisoprenoid-binding protein YceI
MIRSRHVLAVAMILLALAAVPTQVASADANTEMKDIPSGAYQMDANHASITFKINHLGFSHYTGRFDKMEATLNLVNNAPEQSGLDVIVYPNNVDTNNAKLEEDLRGDNWFNVIKFPRATFQSNKIERTGATTAKVSGDFTFMGVTHTIVLDTTLVGSGLNPMTKKPTLGFTATTNIKRSDYGLQNLLPMVGDDVALQIEAEFDKAD